MLTTTKHIFCSEVNAIPNIFSTTSEALSYLYAQVTRTCCLTEEDRKLIKAILLQDCLQEEETRIINRILYSVRRGWITLGSKSCFISVSREGRILPQVARSMA